MSFGLGFSFPNWQTLSGGAFSPAQLFQGGVQGAWYDPSDSGPTGTGGVGTLFSDRAGTTPCAAPGAGTGPIPVAAMLDERAPGYSVYFGGGTAADRLVTAAGSALDLSTGNFTVEAWVYTTTVAAGSVMAVYVGLDGNITDGSYIQVSVFRSGNSLIVRPYQGLVDYSINVGTIAINTWYHVAIVRSGNTFTGFLNGVAAGTTQTIAGALNSNASWPATIGSFVLNGTRTTWSGYISNVRVIKGTAVYTGNFTPTGPLSPISGTSLLTCGTSWSGNPAITVNGDARVDGLNPFQASPVGNHAVGTTTTTTWPTLSARVNLLTYTEAFEITNSLPVSGGSGTFTDGETVTATGGGSGKYVAAQSTTTTFAISGGTGTFSGTLTGGSSGATRTIGTAVGAWGQYQSSIAANSTTAPDGTNTADSLIENTANDFHQEYYNFASLPVTSYTFSIYVKWGIGSTRNISVRPINATSAGSNRGVIFDSTGQFVAFTGDTGPDPVYASTNVGGGWWKFSVTASVTTSGQLCGPVIGLVSGTNLKYTGDGTSGIYIWGADLRPANIGTTIPAYQRVADQYTYDNVGFPRYLAFNGTSSAMSTPANVNLSGTDKATVFAGVRKNADPTDAMLTEFSAVFTNAGSFAVAAPWTSTTLRSYFVAVRGSAINSRGYTGYPAPISNVLTASITTAAADSDAAQDVRINAVDVAGASIQSAASTGNFGTYPLYIGSRNNGSLWLNGQVYGLLIVGSAVSAANITQTEQWVAGKTGITI